MAESTSSRHGLVPWRTLGLAMVLTGLILAGSSPGNGGKNPLPAQSGFPAELAWVPPEASCFIHARFGDIKAGNHTLLLNALFLEFGRPVGDILRKQTDISGDEVDTVTIVFPMAPSLVRFLHPTPRSEPLFRYEYDIPADLKDGKETKGGSKEKSPQGKKVAADLHARSPLLWIIKLTDKTTLARIRKHLEKTKALKETGGSYYPLASHPSVAVHFADENILVFGRTEWVKRRLQQPLPKSATGPLAAALQRAAKKHHLTVGVRGLGETPNKEYRGDFGPDAPNAGIQRVLEPLQRLESATFTVDFGKQTRSEARLYFAKEAEAEAAVHAVQDALVLARILRASWLVSVYRSIAALGFQNKQEEKDLLVAVLAAEAFERSLRQALVEQEGKTIQVLVITPTDLATLRGKADKEWQNLQKKRKKN